MRVVLRPDDTPNMKKVAIQVEFDKDNLEYIEWMNLKQLRRAIDQLCTAYAWYVEQQKKDNGEER